MILLQCHTHTRTLHLSLSSLICLDVLGQSDPAPGACDLVDVEGFSGEDGKDRRA